MKSESGALLGQLRFVKGSLYVYFGAISVIGSSKIKETNW